MKVNIGKNTLGDSDKLSVSLKEYGRSTHDLSYAWRSPMGVGTLVPFMKILALPGDTFDIELDTKVLTHPTVGPLFGQFKMQLDVFTCPLRLYQAQLHNNALNIGLDMKKVKLPKFQTVVKTEGGEKPPYKQGKKYGKGSLAEYLGLRYEPTLDREEMALVNAVPYFAYYDIFKNYYANKQEDYFMLMGGSIIQNATSITSDDFTGTIADTGTNNILTCTTPSTVTITGDNINIESIKKIKYTIDSTPVYINVKFDEGGRNYWEKVTVEKNKIVLKTIKGYNYELSRKIEGSSGETKTLKGTTENIIQGTEVDTYTSSYKLEEIDNLREYILKQGKKEIVIKGNSNEEWLGNSFIKEVLSGTTNAENTKVIKGSIIQKIVWCSRKDVDAWRYGYTYIGDYVNSKTINYITKYMLKINENCPEFVGKVFCSQGIGKGYENSTNARRNRYQRERTIETYKAEDGRELPMPKYYHDKIYSEEEREKLWIIKQERGYRYIGGEKCSTEDLEEWDNLTRYYQRRGVEVFGDKPGEWEKDKQRRRLERMRIARRRMRGGS